MPIGLDACRKVRTRQSAWFFCAQIKEDLSKNCQISDKTATAKWRVRGKKSGRWRSFTYLKWKSSQFWRQNSTLGSSGTKLAKRRIPIHLKRCQKWDIFGSFPNSVIVILVLFDHWRNRVKVFLRFTLEYINRMTSATGAKGKKKALEAIAAKDKLLNSHLTPDCFERQSVFKTSFGQLICRLPSAAILLLFQFFKIRWSSSRPIWWPKIWKNHRCSRCCFFRQVIPKF